MKKLERWLCAILCFVSSIAFSQDVSYQEVAVGDKVPDIEFKNRVNFPENIQRLSDYRGKLVILDFWATFCSPCIRAFPKMEALQRQFPDQIQIVLVNAYEDSTTIRNKMKVYEKNQPNLRLSSLPSIEGDGVWKRLFPHQSIPHHVWIDSSGHLITMTAAYNTTEENIRSYLETGKVDFALKQEWKIDRTKPLFLDEKLDVENVVQYSILIKGKNGLAGAGQNLFGYNANSSGIAFVNTTLNRLYTYAASQIWPESWNNRILIEVADTLAFNWQANDQWIDDNTYSYNLIIPNHEKHNIAHYMLEDLNRYTPYFGRLEKRKMKYLALVRMSDLDKIRSKGGQSKQTLLSSQFKEKYVTNYNLSMVIKWLNNIPDFNKTIFVDETGYEENVDIDFGILDINLDQIRTTLRSYDLDLIEKVGEIEMFVLGDK